MKIHLLGTSDISMDLYQKVCNLLVSSSGPLDFRQQKLIKKFRDPVASWETIFSVCNSERQKKGISPDDFVVLLTETTNDQNWFSACDPDGTNNIFVQTSGWDYYLDCSLEFPLAYEVIENILERLMFSDFDEMVANAHEPPRGCIMDMCSWKPDILYKLRTADICPDCLNILQEKNIDNDLVKQTIAIIEEIRPNTLFSKKLHEIQPNDLYLPFPVAITKHKIRTANQPYHKLRCLIDHFDSLVRTSVIMVGNLLLREEFDKFRASQNLEPRPALGHWVSALKELSKRTFDLDQQELLLPEDTMRRMDQIATLAAKDHIVQLRTERSGHGYAECYEHSYQKDFNENVGKIQEIEEILKPIFAKFVLVYVTRTDKKGSSRFSVGYNRLMGSHPDFVEEEVEIKAITTDQIPEIEKVSLWLPAEKRWQNLDPYILFSQCPACNHVRVLLTDGEVYLDPYQGHRVSIHLNYK